MAKSSASSEGGKAKIYVIAGILVVLLVVAVWANLGRNPDDGSVPPSTTATPETVADQPNSPAPPRRVVADDSGPSDAQAAKPTQPEPAPSGGESAPPRGAKLEPKNAGIAPEP